MFKSRHGFIDPTLLLALAGLVTAIIGTTVATNINQQNSELRSQASVRCTDLSVKKLRWLLTGWIPM